MSIESFIGKPVLNGLGGEKVGEIVGCHALRDEVLAWNGMMKFSVAGFGRPTVRYFGLFQVIAWTKRKRRANFKPHLRRRLKAVRR